MPQASKASLPLATLLLLAAASSARAEAPTPSPLAVGAYAEAYYQWNFGRPSNGITNLRGFDNRANSFTLSNAALDARWDHANVLGHLTLQVGSAPGTYYLAEPSLPGTPSVNATGPELWKFLQQANVGYRFPVGGGLTAQAGLFLSPIGPEGVAVKDNWSWSRSDLFFGLPFYHSGIQLSAPLSSRWAAMLMVCNGWNSVVDNNGAKSLLARLGYTVGDRLQGSLLYFGGVERPAGAAEGRPWRHLFDAWATWTVTPALSLLAHADAGFEPNRFGTSRWIAGAAAARYALTRALFASARVDAFREVAAGDAEGSASAIFWPVPWIGSGTATLDFRPRENLSLRLEYRHDRAGGRAFFGGQVEGDGVTTPFAPNRAVQNTATAGLTTWI